MGRGVWWTEKVLGVERESLGSGKIKYNGWQKKVLGVAREINWGGEKVLRCRERVLG